MSRQPGRPIVSWGASNMALLNSQGQRVPLYIALLRLHLEHSYTPNRTEKTVELDAFEY